MSAILAFIVLKDKIKETGIGAIIQLFSFDDSFIILLFFCIIVIGSIFIYYRVKVNFSNNRELQNEIYFCFSDEGIAIQTIVSALRVRWENIEEIDETKHYFSIRMSQMKQYLVPKRCFEDKNRIVELKALFKNKLPKKKLKLRKVFFK